jgi:hypothetical protein
MPISTASRVNWLDEDAEPTKKIENTTSATLVRRERLRSRLHAAVDKVVDSDAAAALATLDALLGATEGGAA